jgi:hypothetical protein
MQSKEVTSNSKQVQEMERFRLRHDFISIHFKTYFILQHSAVTLVDGSIE